MGTWRPIHLPKSNAISMELISERTREDSVIALYDPEQTVLLLACQNKRSPQTTKRTIQQMPETLNEQALQLRETARRLRQESLQLVRYNQAKRRERHAQNILNARPFLVESLRLQNEPQTANYVSYSFNVSSTDRSQSQSCVNVLAVDVLNYNVLTWPARQSCCGTPVTPDQIQNHISSICKPCDLREVAIREDRL